MAETDGVSLSPLQLPNIVRDVLDFCDGRSLCNSLQVNHLWHQTASSLLKRRCRFSSLLVTGESMNECAEKARRFVVSVRSIPAAVIAFAYGVRRRKTYEKGMAAIYRALPRGTKMIGALVDGIIGMTETGVAEEILEAEEDEVCLSVLVVPKVPGLTVQTFNCGENFSRSVCPTMSSSDYIEMFEGFNFNSVKLIITLETMRLDRYLGMTSVPNNFLEFMLSSCGHGSQIVGGVPEPYSIFIDGTLHREAVVAGMALGGDAFSYGALVSNGDKYEIDEQLQHLRLQVELSQLMNMACFLCICVGRGECLHGEKSVESRLIQKRFSGVPICGFFGQGEVGVMGTHDFTPSQPTQNPEESIESPSAKKPRRKSKRNLAQGFTSSYGFMLIHPPKSKSVSM
ncbi:uncharacterized protein LOC134183351 [Corticium candelabrum]|uniref:uncharacterized protein LOC134183351 n=1 Tax=Corticium candelabrum TaxID=121492 RepID=UPI002E25CA30|nr:uncharacterized protein LOC134183351 [Corticium candelabrum]